MKGGSTYWLLAASLLTPAFLLGEMPVLPQIEQSRQITGPPVTVQLPNGQGAAAMGNLNGDGTSDDAFGTQVLFKRQDKRAPFSAFAEMEAFLTSNVALAKKNPLRDGFLAATTGVSFTQRLDNSIRLDVSVRASANRHDKFPGLDFQSTDLSTGIAWAPAPLRGAEVLLRYTFTDLTSAKHVREFYKNQAILLGIQKVVPFSRAQAVYFGTSAQWSFADPKPAGRDEYGVYAGYRLQLTRHVDADLFYRYGLYLYPFGEGRRDQNHTLSLALHYVPTDWLSFSVSGFLGANRSNQPVFDYDVANVGVGIQASLKF